MAAPTDTPRPAGGAAARAASRRSERAPSGGWRTIAGKEMADHLGSIRFIVLLVVVAIAAVVPMYFISSDISSVAPQAAGQPAIFLALFVAGSNAVGGVTTIAFAALFVPLVGIAFGFDGINSERSQGTLSRLLAQPIHRDDVVNGKFAAGIAVIALMIGVLIAFVTALGILRLGIIPSPEELARVFVWFLATVLYASFWLAFALLISTAIRSTASAALVGFGTWLALILFGGFLLPALAGALFPVDTTGTPDAILSANAAQHLFLRLSPATLYQDVVTAVMNPNTHNLLGLGNLGQYVSAQEQVPNLLSIDQSILLVWPQIVMFLRQEVRA